MQGRFKYPRTPHLPWSPGRGSDDLTLGDLSFFAGREVVVTEKLDGENTTLYRDGLHARSLDPRPHASRDWVKALQARIGWMIPQGWRLCGENLFAVHSLRYTDLRSYFYLFSVWNERNVALAWDDTLEWAERLGLEVPDVLYRGVFDERRLRLLAQRLDPGRQEGYVQRLAGEIAYADFAFSVAKYVRAGHVTTDAHWLERPVMRNGLRSGRRG
ncbi:hypothetical protein HNR42_001853 [Deinobacterium chartae]|uniref:RNA ligase domain-containing protein n=1 Tax=Deinobacterium chartae TaxID=521158 RepID=A0A841I206_9DEIO|nr:RNA ligase family protein [Deinobacterium chartae]MBB6098419.1 hypothetical protein [Deinobacterium chartae]